MRINNLKFKAVGSFKDEFEINFDALGNSGLYLIDGPTGAGKTTIVDCIVFALYDSVSVSETDKSRIRSNFADAAEKTYVELDFTTSKGRFRVRRSPGYDIPRPNGRTSEVRATATLARLDDNNNEITPLIATGVRAVGTEIPKLIGLEKAQFSQTMVLPQGEFAQFIRADTKNRRDVLKKIFEIGFYTEFEILLKQMGDELLKNDGDFKEQLKTDLATLKAYLDFEESEINVLKCLVENRENEGLENELNAAITILYDRQTTSKNIANAMAKEYNAAKELLKTRTNERDSLDRLQNTESILERAKEAESDQIATLVDFSGLCTYFQIKIELNNSEYWLAKKAVVDGEIGMLRGLVEIEASVSRWPTRQATLISEINSLREAITSADIELARIEENLRGLSDLDSQVIQNENDQREVKRDLETALAERMSFHKYLELENRILELNPLREEKLNGVKEIRVELQKLRKGLLASSAATIASQLIPGHACAVCGSKEHPKPAAPSETHVTEFQVEECAEKLQDAQDQLEEVNTEISRITNTRDNLRGIITKGGVEIHKRIVSLNKELKRLLESWEDLQGRKISKADFESRRTTLGLERENNLRYESAKTSTLNSESQSFDRDKEEVDGAKGLFPSISAKIEKLSNLSSLLMTIKSTSEARMQAEETQRLALQTYDAFEQHEKFGEVASAQDLYDTKKGEHQTAQTNLGIINDKVNKADSTYNRIREVLQQRSIAYAENLEILEFVDVIKKNDEDVSLEIYVLQHIFEQVLESANMRFTQLLDGRYQLVSSDTAKGGGKKGLDINVLDLAQNQERVVKTLSGGETFCASLALALGLADVVQAKAGGISIDTLFIDEGFSTLDSDRLDIVMGMLEGIQSLGRTIGIISHVDELKARIPERINVHVLGTGMPSTLSVTWN